MPRSAQRGSDGRTRPSRPVGHRNISVRDYEAAAAAELAWAAPASLRVLFVRTCAVLASRVFLSGGARGGGPSSGSGGASLRSFNSTTSNSESLPPCKNEGLVPPVLRASRADGSLRFGAALEASAAACAAASAAAAASVAAALAPASSSSSAPLSSSCDKASRKQMQVDRVSRPAKKPARKAN